MLLGLEYWQLFITNQFSLSSILLFLLGSPNSLFVSSFLVRFVLSLPLFISVLSGKSLVSVALRDYQWCNRKFSHAGTLKFRGAWRIRQNFGNILCSQNQCRNGIPVRSGTTTPLVVTKQFWCHKTFCQKSFYDSKFVQPNMIQILELLH